MVIRIVKEEMGCSFNLQAEKKTTGKHNYNHSFATEIKNIYKGNSLSVIQKVITVTICKAKKISK